MPVRLPIDDHLDAIAAALEASRAVVVVAPPGSGKTTRLPPALIEPGPVLLLQPRRLAARSLARRIASERGWTPGREVGWQVRFEARHTPATRLLVVTEGILTARLQADPLLSGFRTVVLDEFHERSLHADLALAMLQQVQGAREELRLVVLSATLDPDPIARFLGGCPVFRIPGRPYPVETRYEPGTSLEDAARHALGRDGGHVLCFLPGAPEIRRSAGRIRTPPGGAIVVPLHGSLEPRQQDAAIAPSERRKLILATNIAETSLTVEGVTDVIDTGLHKVLRRDPGSGLDRLETERISEDSAEQRAGRAGRTSPGRAIRLWDPRDVLRARREPEIERVDLAGAFLEVWAWGDSPHEFGWFEAAPREAAEEASRLLAELGAVRDGRITDLGRRLRRFPLHPRLARMLVADPSEPMVRACAILAEGWLPEGLLETADSDLRTLADRLETAPRRVRQAAAQLRRLAPADAPNDDPTALLRAVLAGYGDHVARRREPRSRRLQLASGHGARLDEQSGVREGEFLVALRTEAGRRGPGSEGRVRLASRIDAAWLEPTRREVTHRFDVPSETVRATESAFYGELVLWEREVEVDAETAATILTRQWSERARTDEHRPLMNRLAFAGCAPDLGTLAQQVCHGCTRLPPVDLLKAISHETRRRLDQLAPAKWVAPSGREIRLEYRDDGAVVASVKLQELFGLADSPRIGPARAPVTFELLAPNGRPVQTTQDLRGFWDRTYHEVRKELRGRYPKHPWPEDPWTARPGRRR